MQHTLSVWAAAGFTVQEETFDSEAGKALLKQWGIPETYRGVGFCILGYAAGELPQPKPRKDDQILWID